METLSQADPYGVRIKEGRRLLAFDYHEGQRRAMQSRARFILVLAGLQSGKTVIGPWWLFREMKRKGAGDYLVASPTFRLLDLKCLPEYERLFCARLRLGTMRHTPAPMFELSPEGETALFGERQQTPTRILFGHAQDPDSLESATAKAAHLDEAGQKKFRRASHEAVLGRLSIHQGRVLYTTTPYTLGWLKTEVFDRARAGDPDYEVVQFASTMNPVFPQAEFDSMRGKLPGWKFRMRYLGEFERPAGLIYDNFTEAHKVKRFPIPDDWERFLGLDFGGTHTAGVFLAAPPGSDENKKFYLYRTYEAGRRSKGQHRTALLRGEPTDGAGNPRLPRAVGGSWSEDEWRIDFGAVGLPVEKPPIKSVEEGIDRVYRLLGGNREAPDAPPIRLFVFDDLSDMIDGLESYARELDENDEPTERIEDKSAFHLNDALRYIATTLSTHRTMGKAESVVL